MSIYPFFIHFPHFPIVILVVGPMTTMPPLFCRAQPPLQNNVHPCSSVISSMHIRSMLILIFIHFSHLFHAPSIYPFLCISLICTYYICGHDAKAKKESGRTGSGRLHRSDHHCDRGAPFHRPVGPQGGRVAAWWASSPQRSKCICDAKKGRREVPSMDTPYQTRMWGRLRRPVASGR